MVNIGTHPNIVKLIGVAVQQRPWLVILEYCLYGDLSDVLKALGRRKIALTPSEQISIAKQLAEVRATHDSRH
jgi:serine/threonine protein kinase